jgi:tryptophanyl-tRNA synthetase
MTIYSCATNKTDSEIELKFLKKGYGYFKEAVANAVYEELEPIQKKFKEFSRNKEEIKDFIKKNSEKASIISDKVLKKVKNKIGLILQ